MSTTSIKDGFASSVSTGDCRGRSVTAKDGDVAHRELSVFDMLSLTEWRRLLIETFVFLAVIAVSQRWLFGAAEIPGLPHPYWLPVLLASCQYGVTGGMIAAVAASVVYLSGLSHPSAVQDFYAYAGIIAVQPATWLATALALGGLRSLHIHQSNELADQLAASRQRANDLGKGLERAATEINALERRIALDTATVAALSRSFSLIDMSDRRSAASSYGELFRVATGIVTFTIYLKDHDGYLPVWAVEGDAIRAAKAMEALPAAQIDAMIAGKAAGEAAADDGESMPGAGRYIVRVPPSEDNSKTLAVIACELDPSQDTSRFQRRADEMGRAFATILSASPDTPRDIP